MGKNDWNWSDAQFFIMNNDFISTIAICNQNTQGERIMYGAEDVI